MFRRSFHPIILVIIGFAIFGIGMQLFTNPTQFFTQILVTVGIVAILLLVMKKFIIPRLMGNQASFTQQRSQQIKQTQSRKPTASFKKKQKEKKKSISRPLVKRQSDVKLTVIEGKKNKKKSRALF
ncbi:hypothetical protein CR203_01545 [Salipaludibacillus neizhouensis]|uniref:Uncharacterized protein n=1 Tax=Salipaludibacillus neizhouensis TaxID=885475 RepID=A0A3A9KAX9_9BACI|nr:SA1362 family protein [Salipaludibacillus neizhouensis]RKL68758.1 hypothetical protein CR203_01545 [Salipaludibacillus neizhouensis]